MPSVLAWMPTRRKYDHVKDVINRAADKAAETEGVDLHVRMPTGQYGYDLYETMVQSDLLVTDLSLSRSAIYALGYFDALHKPAILISPDDRSIPYAATHRSIILYDLAAPESSLLGRLADLLGSALKEPEIFTLELGSTRDINKSKLRAFVGYSHKDIECLRRLQVHLKPLERSGLVDIWADTRIQAGEDWKEIISLALASSAIAVLLISADFLASDFIQENELPPLLRAAADHGTTILPLILKPCRFTAHSQLSRFQAINDPAKPLLKLNEIEQEEVYVQLVERIDLELRSRPTT